MQRYVLLLLFIFSSTYVFCQNRDDQFAIANSKIENKTWLIKKECVNDSCYKMDSDYYYISKTTYSDSGLLNHNEHFCFGLSHYTYIIDPIENNIRFVHLSCSPYICFIDTTKQKNTFKVVLTSEVGKENAELSFISDKEFFIYPMYGKRVYFTFLSQGDIGDFAK